MLNKVISKILVEYLGKYIVNIDPKKLHVALFQGDVTLTNLKLKTFALDDIDWNMPIVISHGSVTLKIPWTSIRSSSVICEVSDVFIVLTPKFEYPYYPEEETKRMLEYKFDRLEKFEQQNRMASKTKKKENLHPHFISKLAETIINNLQVKINNIHIRYEDAMETSRPMVLGITMEGLFAQSTDKDWNSAFTKDVQQLCFKLVKLQRLGMYFNNFENANSFYSKMKDVPFSKINEMMKQSIRNNQHQYILKPVSGCLKLKMQKLGLSLDYKKPQFDAELLFDEISLNLNDTQYRNLLTIMAYFSNYPQLAEFRKLRPKVKVSGNEKLWWSYAINSVIQEIRRKSIYWNDLVAKQKDKTQYIHLYKKWVQVPWLAHQPMTPKEQMIFDDIENRRSLEDLLFFRRLANAEIKAEAKQHSEWQLEQKAKKKTNIFAKKKKSHVPEIVLTPEQKKELYKTIGFNEEENASTPQNYVKIKINFQISKGLFTLHDSRKQNTPILQANFDNLACTTQVMSGAFKCLVTVADFAIHDTLCRNPYFTTVMCRRKDSKVMSSSLASLFVEKTLPGSKSDYFFGLNLDRTDIVVNFDLMQRIGGFFHIDQLNLTRLEQIVLQKMKEGFNLIKNEIRLALENKRIVDLVLEIRAPNIIVPVDCENQNSEFLLLDLGKFHIKTDLDQRRGRTDVKPEELDDKLQFSITDAQVLISDKPAPEFFEKYSSNDNNKHLQLAEKINLDVKVHKSVKPLENQSLVQFRVAGEIPAVKVNLSPEKTNVLIRIGDNAMSFIDNPTGNSAWDLKIEGKLKINAPITDGVWKKCLVEVRSTKKIFIFNARAPHKRLAIIKLSERVKIKESKTQKKGFVIELSQERGKPIRFLCSCKDEMTKIRWVRTLKDIIVSLKSGFSISDISSLFSTRQAEQIHEFIAKRSMPPISVEAHFVLKQFVATLQRKGDDIANIICDAMAAHFNHRTHDTVLDLKLKSVTINDLITGKEYGTGKPKTLLHSETDSKKHLVEINISTASKESPLYSKDALVVLNAKFQGVNLFVRPKFLSHILQFGYDIQEQVDQFVKQRNIFYAEEIEDTKHSHTDYIPKSTQQAYLKLSAETQKIVCSAMDIDAKVASFTMEGSTFTFKIDKTALEFSGKLGDVVATDHTTNGTLYPEILGLSSKEEGSLITFCYQQRLKSSSRIAYTKFFTAKMSSIRYVHIQLFINRMLNYLQGPILDALGREHTRTLDPQEHGLKPKNKILVKVSVELINPMILIPTSHESYDGYIANLGRITLKNTVMSKERQTFWLESFDLSLKSVLFSSMENAETKPQSLLSETDVAMNITRALVNPDNSLPKYSLSILVSNVTFKLSHTQYQLLVDMLNENIGEGLQLLETDRAIYKSIQSLATKRMSVGKVKQEEDSQNDEGEYLSDSEEEKVEKKIPVNLVVTVSIPQMNMLLLRGEGKTHDNQDDPLLELSLKKLNSKSTLTAVGESHTQVSLESIVGFDTRRDSKNVFTKLFDSRSGENEECFKLIFDQKVSKERLIQINISNPRIVLVPDVLLDLKEFFDTSKSERKPVLMNKKELSSISDEIGSALSKSDLSKTITFTGKFGKPQIVLPEDSSDKDSRNLVFELGLDICFVRTSDKETGDFGMHDLTVFVESSDSKSRGQSIIEPVTVNTSLISMLNTEYPNRMVKIEVKKGGKSRISYQDLKMIYQIAAEFTNQRRKRLSSVDTSNKRKSKRTSVTQKEVSRLSSENLQHSEHTEEFKKALGAELKSLLAKTKFFINIQLISNQQWSVLVVDDIKQYDIPLLDFNAANVTLNSTIEQKEKLMIKASLDFVLFANYYNFKIAEWEPFLEKTPPITIKYALNDDPNCDFHKMFVESNEVINFNISHSMVDTILKTSELWIQGLKGPRTKIVSKKFELFSIINETGLNFSFWKVTETRDKAITLKNGQEVRFGFDEQKNKNCYINLCLGNTVKKLLISRVGKYHFSIHPANDTPKVACCEIELREGRKIITIHSGLKLKNATTIPWEVGCYMSDNKIASFGVLKPQAKICIPFVFIGEGQLTLRPAEHPDFKWHPQKKEFAFTYLVQNPKPRITSCKKPNSRERYYAVLETIQRRPDQKYLDVLLELKPPFAIENLLGCSIFYTLFDKAGTTEKGLAGFSFGTLQRGDKRFLYSVNLNTSIWMRAILNSQWKTKDFNLIYSNTKNSQLDTRFSNIDPDGRELWLSLDYSVTGEAFHEVLIYCPYWIINQTDKNLIVKHNNVEAAGQRIQSGNVPLMFDFPRRGLLFSNKISIQVENDYTSRPFSIDNAGAPGDIEVGNDKRSFNIGLFVDLGPGKFDRIKVVTLTARFILVNRTDEKLLVKQFGDGDENAITIDTNSSVNYYWSRKETTPMLSIRLEDMQWSAPFQLRNLGEIPLILRRKTPETKRRKAYIVVQLHQEKGIIFVVIEKTTYAPYYITNTTSFDLRISQYGTNRWFTVKKGKNYPYSWLDTSGRHQLIIQAGNAYTQLNIDIVSSEKKMVIKELKKTIGISVTAKERSRFVTITEDTVDESKQLTPRGTSRREKPPKTYLQVFAEIKGIGFSIIHDSPRTQELLYVILDTIVCKYKLTEKHQFLELKLKKFQANNQLLDAVFPVMLTNAKKLDDGKYFACISIIHDYREKSYDYFPYFSVCIQEADVCMDWEFLNLLSNFVYSLLPNKDEKQIYDVLMKTVDEPLTEPKSAKKVYFNVLELHPIKMNITLVFSQSDNPHAMQSPLYRITQTIGALANIDDAPIRLNALILHHPFLSRRALLESIKKHYTKYFLSEMYKIIGSFDFIGNPIGLFNDIDTGVLDLFYKPMDGLTKSPNEFAKSLAEGSLSFIKHSVHGTFNTASKVTESIGSGLSQLTMDPDFINSRQKMYRQKSKHVGEGILNGVASFSSGLFEGATGIITKPIQGASKEGVRGFIRGIGKGLVGIPVKPVTGLLDLAAKTTEGIRNTTTYFDKEEISRTRKPRLFGPDGTLIPYNSHAAEGQEILYNLQEGKFRNDYYLYHTSFKGPQHSILLSDKRVFYLSYNLASIVWQHPYEEIADVKRLNSGLRIMLNEAGILSQDPGWFGTKFSERCILSGVQEDQSKFDTVYQKLLKILRTVQRRR